MLSTVFFLIWLGNNVTNLGQFPTLEACKGAAISIAAVRPAPTNLLVCVSQETGRFHQLNEENFELIR